MFACLRSNQTDAMLAIARDFSPRIERHGPACVVLDVSGLGRLLGDAHAIGAELERAASPELVARVSGARRRSADHGIRIAVAPTQTAARLLSMVRPGLTVAIDDVAQSLADLPMASLCALVAEAECSSGADRSRGSRGSTGSKAHAPMFEVLQRWGLTTVGELAALPAIELSERVGQHGLALQRLARGIDPASLVPDPDVPRFVQSLELEWPIDAMEPLSFVFARLLEPLSASLERADRGAAAIRLDLRLVDRTVHARVLQLPAAMRDARVLRTLLILDLESHLPAAAVDVVSIEVDPAPARIVQFSLLERPLPLPETLVTLTARLGALVGDTRCGSPVLLDTHRPDTFEMRRFAPGGRVAPLPVGSGFHVPAGSGAILLRRFRPPVAIRVAVERGAPVHVAIDRRGMPGGRVDERAGPWRTSGSWWEAGSRPWDRDEWEVALSDGAICRVFRDRAAGRWFLEGVLD